MTAAMETPVKQVAIGQLRTFLLRLGEALKGQGVKPGELAEKLSSGLKVSCLECGMTLTAAEVASLAEGEPPESPKLRRLALGYCARNACRSNFYAVALLKDDAQWSQAWAEGTDQTDSGIVTEELAPAAPGFWEVMVLRYGIPKLAMTGALVLIAIGMVYWQFRTPSWSSQPAPQYKPDLKASDSVLRADSYRSETPP